MKLILFSISCIFPVILSAQEHQLNLLVGTYTNTGKSEGIYVYTFNTETGKHSLKNKVGNIENPSYLTRTVDGKFVYSVNELNEGKGAISAFSFDKASRKLTFLNKLFTGGDAPCHVVVDHANRNVIVSNYSGGSLSVFSTNADGSLKSLLQKIQHEGNGPDKQRQLGPHIHSATFSPDERYLLIQDLGMDEIQICAYHPENEIAPLDVENSTFAAGTSGGGPRHLTFSEDGKYVYLVEEMSGNVLVYKFKDGELTLIQQASLLSEGFTGEVGAADIHLSPDGKFLYASNRGDANDICTFQINRQTGMIKKIGQLAVPGKGPRNFAISPEGNFVLVANQYTDDIVIFERDAKNGGLHDTGNRINVGAPVCLVF